MKINKRIIHSFSDNVLLIAAPTSWKQLDDKDKLYAFRLLQSGKYSPARVKILCFLRYTRMRVVEKSEEGFFLSVPISSWRRKRFFIKTWELHYHIKQLNFITDTPSEVSPVSRMRKLSAVDELFRGIPFSDYLAAENFYQGYIYSSNTALLSKLARILYRTKNNKKPNNIKFSPSELFACFYWWYSLKAVYAVRFNYFFSRVEASEDGDGIPDMISIMNAQIRALTGGDITMEPKIYQSDTYRALTELNEKAREVIELKTKTTNDV